MVTLTGAYEGLGHKQAFDAIAKDLAEMEFTLCATGGTCTTLQQAGLEVERVNKVMEGHPHIVDAIINEEIDFLINTTKGPQALSDSMSIRREAVMHKIPYFTLLTAARAGIQAIRALKNREMDVKPLQDYFDCEDESEQTASDATSDDSSPSGSE